MKKIINSVDTKKKMVLTWVLFGLGAAICFAGMVLLNKKILSLGMSPLLLNLFLFGFTFIGFSIWTIASKTKMEFNSTMIILLILAALFALLGNFLDATATKEAPNPGYAAALKSVQVLIIALLAPLLLGSPLTLPKFIGMALVVGGVVLISVF